MGLRLRKRRVVTPPLKSYVVTFGLSICLVSAKDEDDARARVRAQFSHLRIGDDEIAVRGAKHEDRHLLRYAGGANDRRERWSRGIGLAAVKGDA